MYVSYFKALTEIYKFHNSEKIKISKIYIFKKNARLLALNEIFFAKKKEHKNIMNFLYRNI